MVISGSHSREANKMDMRHPKFINLNMNPNTDSFWGLSRIQAKFLGYIFIGLGLILSDPPVGLLPTDFINVILAGWLSTHITTFSFMTWLVLTYTIIGWSILLAGIWIFPYNSRGLLVSIIKKIKLKIKKGVESPVIVLVSIIIMIFIIRWYKVFLAK